MSAVKTIIDILGADAGVTAIVGTGDDARIVPLTRPQDVAVPAITVSGISLTPTNYLGGDANLDENRVQVDCWADDYSGARALAAACRAAITATGILMLSDLDNFDASAELSGIYRVTQEYSLWL